ncbi:mCG50438, partial [Mus musculus]
LESPQGTTSKQLLAVGIFIYQSEIS